ncbi:ADP-forming succinate--CoA ligase subunit beta [Anaerolineales bacterium HSG24]|nr:ADP-forming succinate--CoA ligase subunit beta [Anaerolineales bacterium HSG24]
MKLHEYQSKRIFADHGVPIPQGDIATTPEQARIIAEKIGGKVVVKSQVLVGGRGKAGGIKLAKDADEAEELARQILGMDIKGLTVETVLIDQAANIKKEIYLGVVIDRALQKPIIIGSSEGGVEIEEVAKTKPEAIIHLPIGIRTGLMDYQARNLAHDLGLRRTHITQFVGIVEGLYRAFISTDASLAEINPLVVTGEGKLLAVDGKIVLDDNALFRHPNLNKLRDIQEETPSEREARKIDINFIKLDGEIGCMVNGAGLAMATMDITKHYGGEPANFLDIGGGAKADKVTAALRIILDDPKVKAVLFNIFGGITRCDEVAKGILEALEQVQTNVPMVARLVGTNEEEGRRILAEANIPTASSLGEAAEKAVALARGV